jgi:hypothetical protein
MNYRTDYEFEEGSNEPNSPIALVIIITWVLIMVVGLISMQSCKAPKASNVSYALACDLASEKSHPKGYDTFIDSTGIIEVLPERKR